MAALKGWFDGLWEESVDVTDQIAVELGRSWALAQTPPYHTTIVDIWAPTPDVIYLAGEKVYDGAVIRGTR